MLGPPRPRVERRIQKSPSSIQRFRRQGPRPGRQGPLSL